MAKKRHKKLKGMLAHLEGKRKHKGGRKKGRKHGRRGKRK